MIKSTMGQGKAGQNERGQYNVSGNGERTDRRVEGRQGVLVASCD